MALVTYSDSENSDDESQTDVARPKLDSTSKVNDLNPIMDKSQPNKIKVNLSQQLIPPTHDEEPPAKRPRVGAGAFTGFNSMLPAPKRDGLEKIPNGNKSSVRKVFSLKTGAEAAFSRESDAELRELFSEQNNTEHETLDRTKYQPSTSGPSFAKPAPPRPNDTFIFKPLSVARKQKKKAISVTAPNGSEVQPASIPKPATELVKQKISLFSTMDETPSLPEPLDDQETQEIEDLEPDEEQLIPQTYIPATEPGAESLDTIASDLNLSKAERRQLFGRNNSHTAIARNVINFNTDEEYAANQELIAQGETVQHNPVRGIAPGKHSLRQLVNAASGQKEALEESFAQGKRNKKEAGNKYGW